MLVEFFKLPPNFIANFLIHLVISCIIFVLPIKKINYENIMKDRKIIKMEIPKVIWDAEMSIFNFRPILKTWMESVQDVVNKTSEIYSKQK